MTYFVEFLLLLSYIFWQKEIFVMQLSKNWDAAKAPLEKLLDELDGKINELLALKDLTKLKSQIDELQSLIEKVPELENTSDNINQLIKDLQQRLDQINAVLPELEQQFDELKNMGEQLPAVQEELKNLTAEIQKLKDEIGQIGGGSGENWQLIYDMTSENADINLGYPDGIMAGISKINNLPNLKDYKKLRIVYCYNYNYSVFIIELDSLKNNSFCFYGGDVLGTTMVSITFEVVYESATDFLRFYVSDTTRVDFYTSKYPKITQKNQNKLYYISKIEATT